MPTAKDVKKKFLAVQSIDDVRDFFVYLDAAFHPHENDEGGFDIDISDTSYFEIYLYKERNEIEKRARRGTALRFCQLAISEDFEDWTFVRHGVEGRVRLLRYRIQKKSVRETDTPIAMQRLAKIGAGKIAAFEDLFERKDISGRFYTEYSKKRLQLIKQISGIKEDTDRRWFAQVLLDRIIFLYFLQKKGILGGDERYLLHKLQEHKQGVGKKGPTYYRGFLTRLFFETLCTKSAERAPELDALTGTGLPYLNGGLFLKHDLEEQYPDIDVDDRALAEVFQFLEGWLWNVSERSETDEDAIDPYILGYIFEKSLGENKAQGVYYTPPFLSEFLARETIHAHLLRYSNRVAASGQYETFKRFLEGGTEGELVALYEHLRSLSICDPACGSGQFLVQALHELDAVHRSLIERGQREGMELLVRHIDKDYPLDGEFVYGLRRFIVAHNLYGVDLLTEAVEITKLRLFIGMVEGLEKDIREPLPNIDFNIRAGNSLIGFTEMPSVVRDAQIGGGEQGMLDFGSVSETFHQRELKILSYYNFADPRNARTLKTEIQTITDGLRRKLNSRLNQFIASEWNVRPKKKVDFVELAKDATARKMWESFHLRGEDHGAFHWVMEFSNVLLPNGRAAEGGFDIMLLNPPWEVWKPNSQEFFEKVVPDFRSLDKNRARKAVERVFARQRKVKKGWLEYSLSMSATTEYFRQCGHYPARGQGDINLYKLFLERAYGLLRDGGSLGIVIPSGFYSDLGCRDLRALFLERSKIHFLYGFENAKAIFEDVHRSFKFVLFSATRDDEQPGSVVPAAFMMHTQGELEAAHGRVSGSRFVELPQALIRQLAPDSLSLMEFRSPLDIGIVEKMARFPRLGEDLRFHRELHVTDDAASMVSISTDSMRSKLLVDGILAQDDMKLVFVYEGKNIWHYSASLTEPINAFPAKDIQVGYKLSYRVISASTNQRTLVATILPGFVLTVNSLNVSDPLAALPPGLLTLCCLNSLCADYLIRMSANNNIHVSTLGALPTPRFQSPHDHPYFQPLVERAARLVGTTAAYDDLLREVFGSKATHETHGAMDPAKRQKLKNEIDAMVARIYGLTEDQLAHVLSTFPLVEISVKDGVLEEWRKLG